MATVFKRTADRNRKDARWLIGWYDGGKRRTRTAFTDKAASLQLAMRLEDDSRKRHAGLIDAAAESLRDHARTPLAAHVADFKASLQAKGCGARHIDLTLSYIEAAIAAGEWKSVRDISADAFQRHLLALRQRRRGVGARTLNARRQSVRAFTRWLAMHNRVTVDPLRGVPAVKGEAADRRRARRPFTEAELAALLSCVESSPPLRGLTGSDRGMLYRVLAGTGLRRSEAASLTRRSFDLDGPDGPAVVVEAGYSKRRRRDVQPIPDALAALLRPWLEMKLTDKPLWRLMDKPAKLMLYPDLERAGIEPRDSSGRWLDLHSFRHTYVSRLAMSGVPVKVAQTLARHSSPTLTLGTYSHVGLVDERAALAKAFGQPSDPAESLRATGTCDTGRAAQAQRAALISTHGHATACIGSDADGPDAGSRNSSNFKGLGASVRVDSRPRMKAAGGTRTHNLQITNQVLCR